MGISNELLPEVSSDIDSEYKISLEVFEGPLDLLLYLIKKDEVAIYDISIERITTQYLEYIESFEVLNIEIAGEFIVMAANLLYIKSRTLLPKDQQMPDEEVEEDDPRWELIRQLIEYKKFKEASLYLRDQEELQEALFPRPGELPGTISQLLPEETRLFSDVSVFDLINAFQKVLRRIPQPESAQEIYEENYTVSDRIQYLVRAVVPGIAMKFEELFSSTATRSELVVTFLAMLELIKMRQFVVRQEEHFSEIWIERPKTVESFVQDNLEESLEAN